MSRSGILLIMFFGIVGLSAMLLLPTRFDLAEVYQKSHQYDKAAEMLEDVPSHNVIQDARIAIAKAKLLYDLGDYASANASIAPVQHMLQFSNDLVPLQLALARALTDIGLLIRALERWITLQPNDWDARDELIELYWKTQQPQNALPHILTLLKVQRTRDDLWLQLGTAYLAVNEPIKSLNALETGLTRVPDSQPLWSTYKTHLNALDRRERLITLNERLIRENPDNVDLLIEQGALYVDSGQLEEARPFLVPLLAVRSQRDDLIYYGRGLFTQKPEMALRYFTFLTQAAPNRADIRNNYDIALLVNYQFDTAYESLVAHAGKTPSPSISEQYISLLYESGRDTAFVSAHVDSQAFLNMPELQYIAGVFLLGSGQYSQAAQTGRTLSLTDMPQRRYFELWMNALVALELPSELVKALQRYTYLWPHDIAKQLELVDAYEWNNQYGKAQQLIGELEKEYPNNPLINELDASRRVAGEPVGMLDLVDNALSQNRWMDAISIIRGNTSTLNAGERQYVNSKLFEIAQRYTVDYEFGVNAQSIGPESERDMAYSSHGKWRLPGAFRRVYVGAKHWWLTTSRSGFNAKRREAARYTAGLTGTAYQIMDWDVEAGGYSTLTESPFARAELRTRLSGGGQWQVSRSQNELMDLPFDLPLNKSVADITSTQLYLPLGQRFALSGRLVHRDIRQSETDRLASDQQREFGIDYSVFQSPYRGYSLLKYWTVGVASDQYDRVHQADGAVVELLDNRSFVHLTNSLQWQWMRTQLVGYFYWGMPTYKEGHFGDVAGATAQFNILIRPTFVWRTEFNVASEKSFSNSEDSYFRFSTGLKGAL
ncbi:MAG: hypothetical protein O3A01_01175 [bacterium]|nr:hypothetical protein [bacterium]